MGGKGSAPPAPDYVGATQLQGQISKENLNMQNFANRPNQFTPFGSQTWQTGKAVDPATGQEVTTWTQNTALNPDLQRTLNDQIAIQNARSSLAGSMINRANVEYGSAFPWSSMPAMASTPSVAPLQSGISSYSGAIDTSVPNRANEVQGAFSFTGPQTSVSARPAPLALNTGNTNVQGSVDPMTARVDTDVSTTPLVNDFYSHNDSLARNTGTEAMQRSLATADNPALPQFDSAYRDNVARTLMERMVPLQERQQQRLETQLSNQGFKQGSEAYKRALDELNQRQAAERYNALDTAGNEAMRLFNMGMGARQQAFSEDVAGGNFANTAAGQAFNQNLAANQFQNQAAAQAYAQQTGAKQAYNQAQQQAFNQALAAGQFGNSAVQQAYAQNLGAAQFANQAANQGFQQNLAQNQFQNQAANQAFQQDLAAGRFGNDAQQQFFAQRVANANLANQAAGQAFNQDLQASQFQNQAAGQQQAMDIARMNAYNQAMRDQFGLNQQAAAFQNQLRQQAIAEQMQRRGMSLNEMNALLSGQQVGLPQMPTFNAAGRAETPNILGATQMGYDAQLGAYNAQNANFNNLLNAGAQIGSAAFMFSDRRLKSNIKRVGTHPIGVGIYDYTMMGFPQRGVIAQEVQKVRPDLVKRHANGYLMVNYGGL